MATDTAMRDEESSAETSPVSAKAQANLSDGAALKGLPLSDGQRRRVVARMRDLERVAAGFEEARAGSDPAVVKARSDVVIHLDDNALTYRMRKQSDRTEAALRKDAFDVHRYDQEFKALWMVLACALSVLLVGLGFAMWLIASGREAIGSPILSAIVSGALSYLAGLGTPRRLLRRGEPSGERG
jgi:hypothetical protein